MWDEHGKLETNKLVSGSYWKNANDIDRKTIESQAEGVALYMTSDTDRKKRKEQRRKHNLTLH